MNNDKVKLLNGLLNILLNQSRIINNQNNIHKSASVALIITLRPSHSIQSHLSHSHSHSTSTPTSTQLKDFFAQSWVQDPTTIAECLFIKRVTRTGDRWSGDVALPGGKSEPEDESPKYTAMRETWEEVGLDLADNNFLCVGPLDDREITTSLGKRLLMILSPYVFINTSPHTPALELQHSEIASAHWIPLNLLSAPQAQYGTVGIDISSRLAPRNRVAQFVLRLLVGSMKFRCILLPNEPESIPVEEETDQLRLSNEEEEVKRVPLRLWGLTLGMTLDLLSKMNLPPNHPSLPPSNLSTYPHATLDLPPMSLSGAISPFAPSMASIFPRFAYADINVLIYLFGWRYRRLLTPRFIEGKVGEGEELAKRRGASAGGVGDREGDQRVNYAGVALGSYYSAVRKALVVAVLLRGLAASIGVGWLGWWISKKVRERRLAKL